MIDGPPESTTPFMSGSLLEGFSAIHSFTGHSSAFKYDTPVPTENAFGSSTTWCWFALERETFSMFV